MSFAHLAGAPLVAGKTTWTGVERRRHMLVAAGVTLANDLPCAIWA